MIAQPAYLKCFFEKLDFLNGSRFVVRVSMLLCVGLLVVTVAILRDLKLAELGMDAPRDGWVISLGVWLLLNFGIPFGVATLACLLRLYSTIDRRLRMEVVIGLITVLLLILAIVFLDQYVSGVVFPEFSNLRERVWWI